MPQARLPPCTLAQALTFYLDVAAPPTPQFLQLLGSLARDPAERERLQRLAQVRGGGVGGSPPGEGRGGRGGWDADPPSLAGVLGCWDAGYLSVWMLGC